MIIRQQSSINKYRKTAYYSHYQGSKQQNSCFDFVFGHFLLKLNSLLYIFCSGLSLFPNSFLFINILSIHFTVVDVTGRFAAGGILGISHRHFFLQWNVNTLQTQRLIGWSCLFHFYIFHLNLKINSVSDQLFSCQMFHFLFLNADTHFLFQLVTSCSAHSDLW